MEDKIPFYSSTGTMEEPGEPFFRELDPDSQLKIIFLDGTETEISAANFVGWSKQSHKPIVAVKVWEENLWKP